MKKKLGIFITLGVVLALAIAVLTLYLVPVNYMPKLNNPDAIALYSSSEQKQFYEKNYPADQNTYNELLNQYNVSFTQNLLSAIFSGQTATAKQGNGKLDVVEKPSASLELALHYNVGQTLIVNNCQQESPITDVFVQLENKTGYVKTSVYFKQVNTDNAYYKYTTYINQSGLYKMVSDLCK